MAVDNVLHGESAEAARAQLSRERDRLRLLVEVSESIASYRDLDDLFKVLSERLPRLVPFDFINLVLHDPARNVMRLQILTTEAPTTIAPGLELPVDESPGGLVWQTQQPLMIGDLTQERRFPHLTPRLLENDVRTYCAVPLTTALRRLGALGFGSMKPDAYDEADLEFMQHMAKQVAVAVDNVLHDESARLAQTQLARERDRLRRAARDQQRRRLAPGHGRDVRGDQRRAFARDSARRLRPRALREGHAPVPLPRADAPTANMRPKKARRMPIPSAGRRRSRSTAGVRPSSGSTS